MSAWGRGEPGPLSAVFSRRLLRATSRSLVPTMPSRESFLQVTRRYQLTANEIYRRPMAAWHRYRWGHAARP